MQHFFADEFLPIKMTDQVTMEFSDDPWVKKFTEYVFYTHIQPNFKFPPSMWVEYSCSIMGTTNPCKAFHHLTWDFYSGHPNIFVLTENLLKVQYEIYAKMLELKKLKRRASIVKKGRTITAVMIHCDPDELSC